MCRANWPSCSSGSSSPQTSSSGSCRRPKPSKHVTKHAVPELGLEPGAFRRHNPTRVRDVHQVFDARREHRKGAGEFPGVDALLQFPGAANAAHKIDAFARPRIVDAEDRLQDIFLEQSDVEFFDRVAGSGEARPKVERVPPASEIKTQFMFAGWRGR